MDQHTGDKWLIHGTKHHKDNQLQILIYALLHFLGTAYYKMSYWSRYNDTPLYCEIVDRVITRSDRVESFMPVIFKQTLPVIRPISRSLQWRHNGRDSVSNHQPHDCLLNRLFRHRSKKTSKLRVTGLCAGHSPQTGEFHAQMASNAENFSIWWRHHAFPMAKSWEDFIAWNT